MISRLHLGMSLRNHKPAIDEDSNRWSELNNAVDVPVSHRSPLSSVNNITSRYHPWRVETSNEAV